MKLFSAIAQALKDIREGAAEGRRQARARRAQEAGARELQAFNEAITKLMGAARLPNAERKAAMQQIDQSMRGNPRYEPVRGQLLASVQVLDASGDALEKLDAIAGLPAGERDVMAELLDQSMRGNPRYEVARAQVLSRSEKASGQA